MLIKAEGRFELACFENTQKHPILLSGKDELLRRYLKFVRRQSYYSGPKALTGLVRKWFWIVSSGNLTRRVVRSCVHCVLYRPILEEQIMEFHSLTTILEISLYRHKKLNLGGIRFNKRCLLENLSLLYRYSVFLLENILKIKMQVRSHKKFCEL